MNPKIPVDYDEVARWLRNFAVSHAKREHPQAEAVLETGDERQGRSYGLRLVLAGRSHPAPGAPPLEFGYAEVVEGRTRFAWCETLAQRIREETRRLALEEQASRPA
jgi:hypothetical protein